MQNAHGATMTSLNQEIVGRIPLPLPPLPEQKAIAHILGTLDDKIELHRRMNGTLESLARALFRSWFVDFDPVRAKAAGRRPHAMTKEIARLFPNALQPSTIGEIPKGWTCGTLEEIVRLNKESVTPILRAQELFEHYSIPAYDEGKTPKLEPGADIRSNKHIVLPDCVLISKLNPRIPRVWLPYPADGYPSICSTEFLVVVPRAGISRAYV